MILGAGLFQQVGGLRIRSRACLSGRQRFAQAGAGHRLARISVVQMFGCLIQSFDELSLQIDSIPLRTAWVEVLKDRFKQIHNCLGLLALGRLFLSRRAFVRGVSACAGFRLQGPHQSERRAHDATDQQRDYKCDRQYLAAVSLEKLSQPIAPRRRASLHRLVVQKAHQVHRHAVGRFIAAIAVLFERLHHDPVQFALELVRELPRLGVAASGDRGKRLAAGQLGAGLGRILFPNNS